MQYHNSKVQNDSLIRWDSYPAPARAIPVCPASTTEKSNSKSSAPSIGAGFNIYALWRSRRLVLPVATAPLFYSRSVPKWKNKQLTDKISAEILTGRGELIAGPDADHKKNGYGVKK